MQSIHQTVSVLLSVGSIMIFKTELCISGYDVRLDRADVVVVFCCTLIVLTHRLF